MKRAFILFVTILTAANLIAAKRYWVGGSGTWTDATNHWAAVSGGSPSSTYLPTSSDSVYFDNTGLTGSNRSITIPSAVTVARWDISAITYTNITFAPGSGIKVRIAGDWMNKSGVTYTTNVGSWDVTGTGTHKIQSNGGTFPIFTVNATGGTYTAQDNLVCLSITITSGTLDLQNYDLDTRTLASGSGTKTLTLGNSSTVILHTWTNNYNTGFTKNFNNSTWKFIGRSTGEAAYLISHELSVYKCIIQGRAQYGNSITLNANLTVSDSIIIRGYSNQYKIRVLGGGARRTISAPEKVYVDRAEFQNIIGGGASAWNLSGMNIGDETGNQNITFRTAKKLYWYSGTGSFADSTKWYTQTAGGGTNGEIPYPQDTAIVDGSSFSGAGTLTINTSYGCGKLDMSAEDNSAALTLSTSLLMFGSIISNGTGTLNPGSNPITVYSAYDNTILTTTGWNLYSLTLSQSLGTTDNYIKLGSDLRITSGAIGTSRPGFFQQNARFDTDGYDVTCNYYWGNGNYMTYWRDSRIECNGNTSYNTIVQIPNTPETFDSGTSTLDINCLITSAGDMQIKTSISYKPIFYNIIIRSAGGVSPRVFYNNGAIAANNLTIQNNPGGTYPRTLKVLGTIEAASFNIDGTAGALNVIKNYSGTTQGTLMILSSDDMTINYVDSYYINYSSISRFRTNVAAAVHATSARAVRITTQYLRSFVGSKKYTNWYGANCYDRGGNTNITFL